MQRPLLMAAVVALALVPVVQAQAPLASVVASGDSALDGPLTAVGATVGYVDGNANARLDGAHPDEPVYLDMDHDGVVSYGDVRLTGFVDYGLGSGVDLSNRDIGLRLTTPRGWFATTAAGAWVLDSDASGSVSEGDVRLVGNGTKGKVGAADSHVGEPTSAVQGSYLPYNRLPIADANRNARYDVGEIVYLDADLDRGTGGGRITVGDLRITSGPLASDHVPPPPPAPTPEETKQQVVETAKAAADSWRSLDWILVVLAVANLAGLALVARAQRPRNPFK